jgi:hypothetical protein
MKTEVGDSQSNSIGIPAAHLALNRGEQDPPGLGNHDKNKGQHSAIGLEEKESARFCEMRIKGIDPNSPPEALKPIFDRSRKRFGRVISPNLVMGHRPEILLAAYGLGREIDVSDAVEPRLKLMASLRAAQMIGCPF